MELSAGGGRLTVNYSERLVTLLREARSLSALGYALPSKVERAAAQAERYYEHALVLQQVAHFYNSVTHEMLPSQQPLMLETALAFERLVKNPRAGTCALHLHIYTFRNDPVLSTFINII